MLLSFLPPVDYGTGSFPCSISVADLNGDFKADLAVANRDSGTVSILLGNGDGTFGSKIDYPAASGAWYAGVGDFNQDGKLDLAVSNQVSSSLSLLLGNGDGSFQPPTNFATGADPLTVVVGDFNNDGKLDVATANLVSWNMSVLLGNGDGTFQPVTNYAAGADPNALAMGDFNHDNNLDLAICDASSNSVGIFLGNGDGTFQNEVEYATGSSPRSLAVSDLNHDGFDDIAVGNYSSDSVSVFLGDGSGAFPIHTDFAVGSAPHGVAIRDFDGDGILDIATANDMSANVSVLQGNGDGTFQPTVNYATGSRPEGIAAGDFNGDGAPDLATANVLSDNISVLLNVPPTHATLTIDGAGAAQYTATTGIANQLTVSLSSGVYTITDAGEPIIVTGPGSGGSTGSGTHTITLPQAGLASFTFDLGDLNDTANLQSLANPTTLTLGAGNDTVNLGNSHSALDDLQASVSIHGGTGTDTCLAKDRGNVSGPTYTLTATTLDRSGISEITFDTLEGLTINAGNGNNTLQVVSTHAGTPVTFNGGTGSDTVIGPNQANSWNLTHPGLGHLNSLVTFTGVENLTGGSGADTFKFSNDASFTGQIDGGGGTDKLSYASWGSAVTVNLQNATAPGLGSFTNIESLIGSANGDTLVALDTANTWQITNVNSGKVSGFTFSAVENLVGGALADTFKFSNTKSVTGSVDGGAGTNTLDYSLYTASVSADLAVGTASATGGISNIQNVTGGAGNDQLRGNSQDNVLRGNGGDDVLFGGNGGNDILVGGAGNDTLSSGPGRSLLIGGLGADQLVGGSDDDLLIGGTTNFDTNTTALLSILAEWKRTDLDYSHRIDHLRGTTPGGRNGTNYLKSTTVHDDATVDMLAGNAGLDWFWANQSMDIIGDLQSGEIVN